MSWVVAKRAWFEVFADRVECGDWNIPFAGVTSATVYRTSQLFIPVRVLQLETEGCTYQFGFNPWANPCPSLSLPITEERASLGMSPASLLLRVAVVLALAYWAWKKYSGD